jgi:cyclopropane-fatty-acyl-phospholipid synthase
MSFFNVEHGKFAYWADYVAYGLAVSTMAVLLVVEAPPGQQLQLAMLAVLGLVTWTALEYLLHRFVLHAIAPFNRWHAEHHDRPRALICAPTILSASLIVLLVFVPAWLIGTRWQACALTFGLLTGYLTYAITHHATHHWRANSAWLRGRKRWHALHHHADTPAYFGVTSSFWDHVFGSAGQSSGAPTSQAES